MSGLHAELWLMVRERTTLFWLGIGWLVATCSVAAGIHDVRAERAELQRLIAADAAARDHANRKHSDWGSAAYYTFHLTYDPPSSLAFAAPGQRKVVPWKHRIRLLALEGQIYEADVTTPTLALEGGLDFAFAASTIAPMLLIFLLHDLRARERTGGRFELLVATAGQQGRLWTRRGALRVAAFALGWVIPLCVGGALEGTPPALLSLAMGAVVLHVLLWWWIANAVGKRARSADAALMYLSALWLGLAVLAPPALQAAVDSAVPVPDGSEILFAHREAVNDAWDLPKESTMTRFVAAHPEWKDHAGVQRPFEWKWYFAFQQVGDTAVADLSSAYRSGRAKRDVWARRLVFLTPPGWLTRTLEALARTDVSATLAYEQSVRDFHRRLRLFYYPGLFGQSPPDRAALALRPEFKPD